MLGPNFHEAYERALDAQARARDTVRNVRAARARRRDAAAAASADPQRADERDDVVPVGHSEGPGCPGSTD
jgi:hypothetical protein